VRKKHIKVKIKNIREFNLPYWEIILNKQGSCLLLISALHDYEVIGCEVIRRFCPVAEKTLTC